MKKFLINGSAVVCLICITSMISGCNWFNVKLDAIGQETVASCGENKTVSVYVRVNLPSNIDPSQATRNVTYSIAPDVTGTSFNNSPNAVDPYHIYLTSADIQKKSGDYAEIHIVKNPNSNLEFYPDSDSGINGVSAGDKNKNLCDLNSSASSERVFYVKIKKNAKMQKHGYSILLVPSSGSTDTPIIIDPKIENNG